MRPARPSLPHPATLGPKRLPHPATVVQRRAPHPATVAPALAPHVATVQRSAALPLTARPLARRPHAARVVQRMDYAFPLEDVRLLPFGEYTPVSMCGSFMPLPAETVRALFLDGEVDVRMANLQEHILGGAQLVRVQQRLNGATHEFHALRGLIELAKTPRKQLLTLKCYAAHASLEEIALFVKRMAKYDELTICDNIDLTRLRLQQQTQYFCASATVQVMMGQINPIYALDLKENNTDLSVRHEVFKWSLLKSNKHVLLGQQTISSTYSDDPLGGLTAATRMLAFNGYRAVTGYQYCWVEVTESLLMLRQVESKIVVEPSYTMPANEAPERFATVTAIIAHALAQGLPVGVGVGAHAELFVDLRKEGFMLYEPTAGTLKPVPEELLLEGKCGSNDFVLNMIVPIFPEDDTYMDALRSLNGYLALEQSMNRPVIEMAPEGQQAALLLARTQDRVHWPS